MGLLRVLGLGFELTRRLGDVLVAVAVGDDLADFVNGDRGERHRVGAHVGDQADIALARELDTFVEFLRNAHGPLRVETELARCFLLQSRCREGRGRVAAALTLRDADCGQLAVRSGEDGFLHVARLRFVLEAELLDLVTAVTDQPGYEWLLVFADIGLDGPVLARLECLDFQLTLDDQP